MYNVLINNKNSYYCILRKTMIIWVSVCKGLQTIVSILFTGSMKNSHGILSQYQVVSHILIMLHYSLSVKLWRASEWNRLSKTVFLSIGCWLDGVRSEQNLQMIVRKGQGLKELLKMSGLCYQR